MGILNMFRNNQPPRNRHRSSNDNPLVQSGTTKKASITATTLGLGALTVAGAGFKGDNQNPPIPDNTNTPPEKTLKQKTTPLTLEERANESGIKINPESLPDDTPVPQSEVDETVNEIQAKGTSPKYNTPTDIPTGPTSDASDNDKNDTSYNTPQSTPELVADMGEYNKQSFSWENLQNKEDGSKHSSNTKNGKSMSTQEKGLNVGDPGLNLKGVHFQYKGNESERSDEKPDNNQSQIKSNNSEMFAKNSIPTPPPDFEMIPSDDGQNGNNKEGIEQKQPSLDDSTPNQATPQRQPEKRLKKEEDKEKDQPASPDRWPGPTAIAETNTEDSPNDPETEREKPEKIISAMKEGMAKLSSKKLSPANTLELSKLNNQLSSIIIAALGAGVFSQPGNVQAMDTNQNFPDNTYTQRASAEAINESLIRQAYIDYAKYPENHHWEKITIEEFLNLPENKGKYPGITADDIRQLMREIDGRTHLGNIKRPLGKSINSGELSTVKAYLSGKIRPVKPVATNYNQTPGVNNKSNNDIDSRSNVYIGKGSGVDPSQVTANSTSEVSIGGFQNE